MAETWLRVVLFTCDPAGTDKSRDHLEGSIQGTIRRLNLHAGFHGGQWGRDPEEGRLAAVTHWASRAAIEAAEPELAKLAEERAAYGLRRESATNLCLVTTPRMWDRTEWDALARRSEATWLRVVLYRPQHPEDPAALEYLRSSTTSALQMLDSRDGFRIGYWGHDPVTKAMAAVTYWDSLDAIRAAGPDLERLHAERLEHGIETSTVANLELFRVPALASVGLDD